MLRIAWLSLLFSLPAFALDVVTTTTTSSAPPRFALSAATASLVSFASSGAALGVALSVPNACTQAFGSPRPLCAAAGVALGGAVQLALTALLLPEVFRLSGLDPAGVRAGWWRWARWPAAALLVASLVFLAGSATEQKNYGSAQGTMIGGLAGTVSTGLTIDVMGVIGAVRAAKGLP